MRHRISYLLPAALLLVTAPAWGQVRQMANFSGVQPVAGTIGFLQNANTLGQARYLANPNRFGVGGGFGFNGGGCFGCGFNGGYGYYGGGYYGDFSTGNTLQGAASVITAQGQFNIQNQQAKLGQQQVEQEKVKTRRAQFDEYLYEKANTPTVEDIRAAQMEANLRNARNNPNSSDVWSGQALNTLLKTIQQEEAALGGKGPPIPLDQTVLKDIHLNSGVTGGGGVGALRNGNLEWPLSLQSDLFSTNRKNLDDTSNNLVKQASAGKVDGRTLMKFQNEVTALKAKVKAQIDDMPPSENIKANRFCNELLDAVRTLEDPSAVNSFNGKWDAKAANVPELVDQLTKQGLSFAPAAAGDESAYNAVYRALAAYDMSLAQMTARLQSAGRQPQQ